MENWTGIVKGTNRGLVNLRFEYTDENNIVGNFTLFDADTINISAKAEGLKEGNKITARLFGFSPEMEGVPTEGTVELFFSEDGKELKGTWSTNVSTKGECVLYRLKIEENNQAPSNPLKTLETKRIAIEYHSFEKENILELFKILGTIAEQIREGKEKECVAPIYAITYDKEESIRTFSFDDFREKLKAATKIWHVGFEFQEKKEMLNLIVNLHQQNTTGANIQSSIQVSSTEKNNAIFIPEIARGFISKYKNKNWWLHHWAFEAVIQLSAVVAMVSLSYMLSNGISSAIQSDSSKDNTILWIIFIAVLLILSNSWTYIRMFFHNYINTSFPVVDIICKPKSNIFSKIVVGVIPAVAIWCISKYWSELLALIKELIK